MASPTLSSSNCTNSGNDTATNSWAISRPAQSTGDLILCHVAWDDSTNTTSLSGPSGPGGETPQVLVSAHTGGTADQRISVWYWIAASNRASGSYTVTPSASEQWTATVVRVPAGEFDATTPIGANTTGGNSSSFGTTVPISAFTAGATDGDGRLCAWLGVDSDPITSTPDGWTNHASEDRGAVSGTFSTRNAAVTNSESINSVSWGISGDSSATFAYILRAPIDPNGTATPGGLATTASVGTAAVTGEAITYPAGLALAVSLGTVSASGAAAGAALPAGVIATASLGAATVSGTAIYAANGLALAASVGTATATGAATTAPVGQWADLTIGISVASGAAVGALSGQTVTAHVGSATPTGDGNALVAGLLLTSYLGTVVATGDAPPTFRAAWARGCNTYLRAPR